MQGCRHNAQTIFEQAQNANASHMQTQKYAAIVLTAANHHQWFFAPWEMQARPPHFNPLLTQAAQI